MDKTIWQCKRWNIALLFEPRDLWCGIYWNRQRNETGRLLSIYVCIVPMFPVLIEFWRNT